MTDLEMTKLCAEAMELAPIAVNGGEVVIGVTPHRYVYRPLRDDAQVMALVKRVPMSVLRGGDNVHRGPYRVISNHRDDAGVLHEWGTWNDDLNRAIVECVAKMRATDPDTRSGPQEKANAE